MGWGWVGEPGGPTAEKEPPTRRPDPQGGQARIPMTRAEGYSTRATGTKTCQLTTSHGRHSASQSKKRGDCPRQIHGGPGKVGRWRGVPFQHRVGSRDGAGRSRGWPDRPTGPNPPLFQRIRGAYAGSGKVGARPMPSPNSPLPPPTPEAYASRTGANRSSRQNAYVHTCAGWGGGEGKFFPCKSSLPRLPLRRSEHCSVQSCFPKETPRL